MMQYEADKDELYRATVMAGAWYLFIKHRAREIEDAYATLRKCMFQGVSVSGGRLRLTEFGEALATLAGPVHALHPAALASHEAAFQVIDAADVQPGLLDDIYKEARRLGVPSDSLDMLR